MARKIRLLMSWTTVFWMKLGGADRTVAVMNPLLSVYPGNKLCAKHGLVVFRSKAQVLIRAHGIAPATLRRHPATLMEAELLVHKDSPERQALCAPRRAGGGRSGLGPDILSCRSGGNIGGCRDPRTVAVFLSLGGSPSDYEEVCATMGPENAAIVMPYALERAGRITSAGGYRRDLTRRTESGEFPIGSRLISLARAKVDRSDMTG